MSKDYSKYFLSCENTDELRVMDANTNQLIKTIPVGNKPQEMVISSTQPYLFITCNDTLTVTLDLGEAYRKTIRLSPDGSKLLATNWQSQDLAVVNTTTMQVEKAYPGANFDYPESIATNAAFSGGR